MFLSALKVPSVSARVVRCRIINSYIDRINTGRFESEAPLIMFCKNIQIARGLLRNVIGEYDQLTF